MKPNIGERGIPYLNIAEIWPATGALGPGVRAVVWVQGCPFQCPGCISPEWIPEKLATQARPDELAEQLLENPEVQGFTFSGGEPMAQAAGLAALVQHARQIRPIDVICFTGFVFEGLRKTPIRSGIQQFLNQIDVLIDGQYVAALNDNRGMRGSSNQRIIYLTDRLKEYRLDDSPRRVEIHIENGYLMMIGVPPSDLPELLQSKLDNNQDALSTTDKGDEI